MIDDPGTLAEPFRPKEIDDVTLAFPARVAHLMPPYDPQARPHRDWVRLQQTWFFEGLRGGVRWYPKDGIDVRTAIKHLSAIQRSFEPKHEHKEQAVARLLEAWFDAVVVGDKTFGTVPEQS